MTTTAQHETEQILYDMLTENTGTHAMDSGGAYGRHWQDNQHKTLADFQAEPPVSFHGDYFTRSVFRFLSETLEYDEVLDRVFHEEYLPAVDPDDSRGWVDLMEGFGEWLVDNTPTQIDYETPMTVNTYNHESLLSQTIQYTRYGRYEGFILLQIHGGCDVRGGYTRPHVFTFFEDYPTIHDDARMTLVIRSSDDDDGEYYDTDDGGYRWYGPDGCYRPQSIAFVSSDDPDPDGAPPNDEIVVFLDENAEGHTADGRHASVF